MATVATRERPILMSAPMVRAVLAGTKSVTRRVVKPQPPEDFSILGCELYTPETVGRNGELKPGKEIFGVYGEDWGIACPYGGPGDRLWVRETIDGICGCDATYTADDERLVDAHPEGWDVWKPGRTLPCRKIPSIFMPRWASRLTLEIVSVRVERLQEISGDDLTAEGFPPDDSPPHDGTRLTLYGRRLCFAELWDKLNPKTPWEDNPFVWRIAFKRL